MLEMIGNSIDVLVYFSSRRLKPVQFVWQNKAYSVGKITQIYTTYQGSVRLLNFAVENNGNLYHLVYNTVDHNWFLEAVYSD
jgi:hypothetical protein